MRTLAARSALRATSVSCRFLGDIAWETNRGATALECAGTIHTDLARGFIRAEVVNYDDLEAAGSYAAARAAGKVRLEGKEYLVSDGDILVIRFNINK